MKTSERIIIEHGGLEKVFFRTNADHNPAPVILNTLDCKNFDH